MFFMWYNHNDYLTWESNRHLTTIGKHDLSTHLNQPPNTNLQYIFPQA